MAGESILSVGIDIGTSTTQVIFSRLTMDNTASYFAVPHVSIVAKDVVYKSEIYITPLKTQTLIDADAVRDIVQGEFESAGFIPADTDTGAVIITGESARKENASAVLEKLSDFAGEFVVSTAGPDLESIVAGKGSGAAGYSKEYSCTVVNLDIGGGTTNIAVFDSGDTVSKGCVDIGGRLIKTDKSNVITYVSESARRIAESAGVSVEVGDRADVQVIEKITDRMCLSLENLISGKGDDLLKFITTKGSTPFQVPRHIDALCFSGGVADCIYTRHSEFFKFGDIGEILGSSIRNGSLFATYKVIEAGETIRATVVGAGTYTTSVSGSTIDYSDGIFPLKNVPVLYLNEEEERRAAAGDKDFLTEKIRWFSAQSDSDRFILALRGERNPSYTSVKTLAQTIAEVFDRELNKAEPIIVVVENDMAKALGQAIKRLVPHRDMICIDSVKVEENDFVDMGRPMMNGLVIPVVVKTLIFG